MTPLLTVTALLILGAFILTLMSAAGKVAIWVPVILICIAQAVSVLPLK